MVWKGKFYLEPGGAQGRNKSGTQPSSVSTKHVLCVSVCVCISMGVAFESFSTLCVTYYEDRLSRDLIRQRDAADEQLCVRSNTFCSQAPEPRRL